MKILHICLANFYIDNYSYQENLLTKYHKKMGLDVEIIASLVSFDKNGKEYINNDSKRSYNNEDGIPVRRLNYKKCIFSKELRLYDKTYRTIEKVNPDVIFIHGCQFMDIKEVVKFVKKNPNVIVYVDNHADYSNSATNWLSKNILHKVLWRKCAKLIEPYTKTFYGVLPARVKFLNEVYKVPLNKIELLVMGADDERVNKSRSQEVITKIKAKYNIAEDDFLIVTGGKIDTFKRQVVDLMNAVILLGNPKVKLIVYGSVIKEMQQEVTQLATHKSIEYIGWIDNEMSYDIFSAADLLVFPGRHSVYWEQVVAMGKPLVVKYWEGTSHIDIGGNCIFLYKDTSDEIHSVLNEILNSKKIYEDLLNNAQKEEKKSFLYSQIAKKSINA